jgi:hypothetical protein
LRFTGAAIALAHAHLARWQSGHAAACKAVYAGSIPTLASMTDRLNVGDVWPEGSARSRELEDIDLTRAAGQEWLQSGRSCVLRVPSIVVPEEHNLVMNPLHAEARAVTLVTERSFTFDGCLL